MRDKFLIKRWNNKHSTNYIDGVWFKADESDKLIHLPKLYLWTDDDKSDIRDLIDIVYSMKNLPVSQLKTTIEFVRPLLDDIKDMSSNSLTSFDLGSGVYADIMDASHFWKTTVDKMSGDIEDMISSLTLMCTMRDTFIGIQDSSIDIPDKFKMAYVGTRLDMEYTPVNHSILKYIYYMDMIYGEEQTKEYMVSNNDDNIYSVATRFFYKNYDELTYDHV